MHHSRIVPVTLVLVFLVAVRSSAAQSERPADTVQQPNIIMFLVDDMGWQDTSVPFHSEPTPFNRRYHTPAMERLAAGGMKFTQAYSCTVCSPTRVSLMTGLNAARHRVTNWVLRVDPATDKEHPTLRFPAWNSGGMCATSGTPRTVHATPLAEVLRGAGYRTIHVGKAHFGALDTPGADPQNLGFDVNIAGHAAGAPASYLGTENFARGDRDGNHWNVPGLEKYHGQDIFLTEALTIEANAAMDAAVADGKPFYLYMAHYAVHTPYSADDRFYQMYRDAGLDHKEAMYAALLEGMDKSLGDLLDNVERHGLTDQTIVLFMSDNGGLSAHARGGGPPHTHNKPLASGKGSAYEGGIRVPMIVRWPGVTQPGSACAQPVIIEDFFPTILDMAGVQGFTQIGGVIDGRSFVGLLHGEHDDARDGRPLFWHYPNMWGASGPGIGPSSTIRQGDWKLIYYYTDGNYELFNLADDLGEHHNLADAEPQVRDRLARQLGDHLASIDAQTPIDKQTGQSVALPGAKR